MNPILVEVYRGGLLESFHRGVICIVNQQNEIIFSVGDTEQICYPRSAMKLLQVIPLIINGGTEKFNFTLEEISIKRDLKFSTIINHLEKLSHFVNFENHTNLQPNLRYVDNLKMIIKEIGRDNLLSEFYERLNLGSTEEISYDKIRHCLFYIDFCS